jgi:hypothetical protein
MNGRIQTSATSHPNRETSIAFGFMIDHLSTF